MTNVIHGMKKQHLGLKFQPSNKKYIMAGTTTKGLRFPSAEDSPAARTDIKNLADDVDANAVSDLFAKLA